MPESSHQATGTRRRRRSRSSYTGGLDRPAHPRGSQPRFPACVHYPDRQQALIVCPNGVKDGEHAAENDDIKHGHLRIILIWSARTLPDRLNSRRRLGCGLCETHRLKVNILLGFSLHFPPEFRVGKTTDLRPPGKRPVDFPFRFIVSELLCNESRDRLMHVSHTSGYRATGEIAP